MVRVRDRVMAVWWALVRVRTQEMAMDSVRAVAWVKAKAVAMAGEVARVRDRQWLG